MNAEERAEMILKRFPHICGARGNAKCVIVAQIAGHILAAQREAEAWMRERCAQHANEAGMGTDEDMAKWRAKQKSPVDDVEAIAFFHADTIADELRALPSEYGSSSTGHGGG